jgi:SAM-dependent methyltransferase
MSPSVPDRLRGLARRSDLARRAHRSAAAAARTWRTWPNDGIPARDGHLAPWPSEGEDPTFPGLVSQACTDMQIRAQPYRVWGERLRVRDIYVHRKQWEWFYIAQALEEAGVVHPGASGIGFGVGTEPLTPWFASQGCRVLATDYPGGEHADDWSSTGELAHSLGDLNQEGICDPEAFERLVSFLPVDMRKVPDLDDRFDFAWSSCAIEHLGSIKEGLEFLRDHLKLLRPGGVAVHTTELNISSDDRTIDHAPTVLFRRSDLERFVNELAPVADVAPLNFNLGDTPNDRYVAPPHGFTNTMLRLAVGDHVTTSFGLIIRKKGAE